MRRYSAATKEKKRSKHEATSRVCGQRKHHLTLLTCDELQYKGEQPRAGSGAAQKIEAQIEKQTSPARTVRIVHTTSVACPGATALGAKQAAD
jgi:hypothetical protein